MQRYRESTRLQNVLFVRSDNSKSRAPRQLTALDDVLHTSLLLITIRHSCAQDDRERNRRDFPLARGSARLTADGTHTRQVSIRTTWHPSHNRIYSERHEEYPEHRDSNRPSSAQAKAPVPIAPARCKVPR